MMILHDIEGVSKLNLDELKYFDTRCILTFSLSFTVCTFPLLSPVFYVDEKTFYPLSLQKNVCPRGHSEFKGFVPWVILLEKIVRIQSSISPIKNVLFHLYLFFCLVKNLHREPQIFSFTGMSIFVFSDCLKRHNANIHTFANKHAFAKKRTLACRGIAL